VLIFCFLSKTKAQQISLVDQYYINPSIYNPAAVGYNNLLQAYILRNDKFKDFDGGQTFHILTLGAGLKEGKYGLGINLMNNSIDIFNSTQVDFSYSYRIKVDDDQYIRLGLSAGIFDFRLNFNNQNADMNDELLQATKNINTEFIANFGAYYINKQLTLGLAIPQLMKHSDISRKGSRDLYHPMVHFMLSGSYEIHIRTIKDLSFVPNFIMRYTNNSPIQYDINALLKLKNKGWFAVNYKNKYAIGLNIGINALENLKVGYSYNVNTQGSAHFSATNHEFLIGYSFRKTSNKVQNSKSKELTSLKNLLEDKYNRINKLEKELEKYTKDKRFKNKGRERNDVLIGDENTPKPQPLAKVDKKDPDISSNNMALVSNEVVYPEKPFSVSNDNYTVHEVGRIQLDKKIENLFFEFGKSDLSERSSQKADKIALIMQEHNNYILKLHGYTSDTRSKTLNNVLANKRLYAVYNYLIKNSDLEGRIIIIPHDEDTALQGKTGKKSRAFNRRVHLELYSYK